MVYQMQQNTALWCLFDSTIREVGNTNITLGHSHLEATGKKLDEKKAQFDYFDKSCIWGFGNARHQSYGKTQWHDSLSGIR